MPEQKGGVWKTKATWNKVESKTGKEWVESKLPKGMDLIVCFTSDSKWILQIANHLMYRY